MLKLMRPGPFYEKELQQGIEEFWRWLFPSYPLLADRMTIMPSDWRPDVVAFDGEAMKHCLLIELKGRPPGGKTIKNAVRQVGIYAQRLQEVYPDTEIMPMVVGPFKTRGRAERRQYGQFVVVVVHVAVLCGYLAGIAEQLLRREAPYGALCFTEWLDIFT